MFLRGAEDFAAFDVEDADDCEEDCDVHHRDCLASDADSERAFAAYDVDEEEGADDGGDEFDDLEGLLVCVDGRRRA